MALLAHFDSASLSPLLVSEAAPWRDLKVQGASVVGQSGSGAERTLTALLQPTQDSSVAPAKHVTSSSQQKELVADADEEPFPFYISAH